MRAKHAAIIREGIMEARYDAARLAFWSAYLRTLPAAAQQSAWEPVMDELMAEIEETL